MRDACLKVWKCPGASLQQAKAGCTCRNGPNPEHELQQVSVPEGLQEQKGLDVSNVELRPDAQRNRHPTISSGAPDLPAEWDWEAKKECGWYPDQITLGSVRKVHCARRMQAGPGAQMAGNATELHWNEMWLPFPSGKAVCACNSLAVQCPEAADLWDSNMNGNLTPNGIAVQSNKLLAWKGPDGRQWQQRVAAIVNNIRRHEAKMKS